MTRQFHKMHGLGNDFVVIDAREQPISMTPALAKVLADRHLGIGCDQLIVIEPSTVADVRMRIWNHDGGEVESCGNASRCVVALTGAKSVETGGGLLEGATFGAEVEVTLPPPLFAWDELPLNYPMDTAKLPLGWGPLDHPMALRVGNPHLVFFVPDETAIDLASIGPSIEHDPAFPERINVN
ncbi:MAG TPA: diaminopimelate epimerase, partial [Sphingomicrobium sp.]